MAQDLFGGGPRERMVEALRALHRSLLESTRRDYERAHGPVKTSYAFFALAAQDPAFAWLRPMTRLIVDLEEVPVRREDPEAARGRIHELLSTGGFASEVHARVQSDPAVAADHGRLRTALKEAGPPLPPGE